MRSIVFKPTMPALAVITRFTTAALLLLALAACNSGGGGGTKKDTSIPLEPTNLIAIGVNKGIDLSWNKARGAISYTVYYHTASFDNSTDSTTDGGVKSKTDITTTNTSIEDLTNGILYYLRVEAITEAGGSHLSKIASAEANLQPPTSLNATGVYKGVELSWGAVKGATSYSVYYHTISFDSSTDSTTDGGVKSKTGITETNASITGLTNGTEYYLRVESVNAEGKTKLSKEVTATPKLPAPHPSATASINSPAAVDLSWDAVAGVTNYKIYYAKVSLDKLGYENYLLPKVGGKLETTEDTSPTIGDLSADTTYYFVVAANYNGKEKAAPEVSANSSYIAELAVGDYHGCVRLNTGSIKCWGRNTNGQLGVGDKDNRTTATSVSGNLRAKQLSAGGFHSCAIEDLSDRLYCWGGNGYFKLGLSDDNLSRIFPTLVTQANLAKVSVVSAGRTSTCALADGNNYCWGNQNFGGLGNGVSVGSGSTMTAQKIKIITRDVQQFAVGDFSGCAIDAIDHLWCWGSNSHGQVGDDTTTDRPSPVKPKLQGNSFATMLDGKTYHYCAVDKAKKIQCWGFNIKGQLGIDSTTDSNTPQYVLDSTSDYLSNVSKIATGYLHSCALIEGGMVRCWGKSEYGIIGTDGGADRRIANADMPDINNAIDIAAGGLSTCVLLADKASVKCWGNNEEGQLGNGTNTNSYKPVAVKGL